MIQTMLRVKRHYAFLSTNWQPNNNRIVEMKNGFQLSK